MKSIIPPKIYKDSLDNLFKVLNGLPYHPNFVEYKKELRNHQITYSPIGNTNSKTALPSTYRTVGPTCPMNCKFHPEHGKNSKNKKAYCYAKLGFVGVQMQRVNLKRGRKWILAEDLNAAMIAMYYRQLERKRLLEGNISGARLHTSGDFYWKNKIEVPYIRGLCYASTLVQSVFPGTKEIAYTYTAIPREDFEPYRIQLLNHKIFVNYSRMDLTDLRGGETVVWKHSNIDELKDKVNEGTKIIPCLNQVDKQQTCRTCGLCGYKNHEKILIVFDPHGPTKNIIENTMRNQRVVLNSEGKLIIMDNE